MNEGQRPGGGGCPGGGEAPGGLKRLTPLQTPRAPPHRHTQCICSVKRLSAKDRSLFGNMHDINTSVTLKHNGTKMAHGKYSPDTVRQECDAESGLHAGETSVDPLAKACHL